MGSWYLAALRACAEMAGVAGDADFAGDCRQLFDQRVAVARRRPVQRRLLPPRGPRRSRDPDLIAAGPAAPEHGGGRHRPSPICSWPTAAWSTSSSVSTRRAWPGSGDLLDPDHVRPRLRSVHRRNFQHSFTHHFNHMRSFVLGDEAAVLMCTYDADKRPTRPFPYFNEVMTGFEYTAATGLLQVGAAEAGLEIIRAIRDRYDGAQAEPVRRGRVRAPLRPGDGQLVGLRDLERRLVRRAESRADGRRPARPGPALLVERVGVRHLVSGRGARLARHAPGRRRRARAGRARRGRRAPSSPTAVLTRTRPGRSALLRVPDGHGRGVGTRPPRLRCQFACSRDTGGGRGQDRRRGRGRAGLVRHRVAGPQPQQPGGPGAGRSGSGPPPSGSATGRTRSPATSAGRAPRSGP